MISLQGLAIGCVVAGLGHSIDTKEFWIGTIILVAIMQVPYYL